MKYVIALSVLLLIFDDMYSQQPALATEAAQTLGARNVILGAGTGFFTKNHVPVPDVPQSEWRVGVLALRVGVADNVNFDVEWRGRLIARIDNGVRAYDWGDITIATKINVIDEDDAVPAFGIRSAVKLPNTAYFPHKLGNNQTDYYFQILVSKKLPVVELRTNIGLGIIGNPLSAGSQDDIYIISTAVILPTESLIRMYLEFYGFTGSFPNNDKLVARLGIVTEVWGTELSIFGSRRIMGSAADFGSAFEASEDWGVGIFLAKSLKL